MLNISQFKKLALLFVVFTFSFNFSSALPLIVELRADYGVVEAGKIAKVRVLLNKPVLKFVAQMVSIDGGRIESVRKLSSTSYLLFIRVNDDTKELDIIVEDGVVQDVDKVFNDGASNNIIMKVKSPKLPLTPIAPAVVDPGVSASQISELLEKVVKNTTANTQATTNNNSNGFYYCAGVQIPNTQACNPTAQQQQQQIVSPTYYPATVNSTGYYDSYGNYYPPTNNSSVFYGSGYDSTYYGSGYGDTYSSGVYTTVVPTYFTPVYTTPIYTTPVYTKKNYILDLLDW